MKYRLLKKTNRLREYLKLVDSRWLKMAAVDIVAISLATILAIFAGIQLDKGNVSQFLLATGGVILLNGISYTLSWVVSWLIYNKAG